MTSAQQQQHSIGIDLVCQTKANRKVANQVSFCFWRRCSLDKRMEIGIERMKKKIIISEEGNTFTIQAISA